MVITLLKDMLKQLQKEAEEDEDIYDKIACWCETNDKEKTKAIKDAEEKIDILTSKIEEMTARSAQLATEIKNLEKEIAKHQDSMDKATAIREKELAEFNAEEKDLLESIAALKAAITVLSKHHGGSLLQLQESKLISIAATLQHELQKHGELLKGVLTHKQHREMAAFMQAPSDFFDASPIFKQSYAPQSGQIFGILKQMKETFETNLSESQKAEMAAQKAYEELKAALEAQIAAAQDAIDKKTQELADTDEKLANSKEDLEDTRAKLSADEEFLRMLKEKCQMTDQEWEERQKTRQLEMEAVSKALAILSSDDAHDTFTRTFNPALLQMESSSQKSLRSEAAQLLKTVAQRVNSPRLSAIAVRCRLDAFTRVKKAIDDMIAQLLKEKEDEIKHKDFCVDDFNTNQLETENKEFQLTVADQRATQKLLQQALTVLKGFYEKGAAAALIQKAEPAGPPPPPGFKEYKTSAAAGGVMGMIQQIINDAKAMEAETIRAEEDAQKAYEDFVKETNASIEAASKAIVNKSEEKAKAEADLVEAEDSLSAVELELEQLGNYKLQLHQSCDFVLKNFEIRQTARDEEIEALKQAKAILSGAKFESFWRASSE